jgi:hypothetical protein
MAQGRSQTYAATHSETAELHSEWVLTVITLDLSQELLHRGDYVLAPLDHWTTNGLRVPPK